MTLPLAGIRVLDFTMVWAGPYATRILGDLGAEVIKLEGVRNWDSTRGSHQLGPDAVEGYNKSAYYNHLNRNKLSCTLDLADPAGRELCLRIAAKCDVVLENYRPDVMKKLGLEYEAFRAVKQDIIMVSMPGHGRGGPEEDRIAFGTNIEQLGGLVSLQGYEDRGPHKSGVSYGDPISGIAAAGAIIAALFFRNATGKGNYIELAQREALTTLVGEKLVGYSMTGEVPGPTGNKHAWMAPHNVYRTNGYDDEWVAIACRDDADFERLCAAMGQTALLDDPRFADLLSRHCHQEELDLIVTAWTSVRTAAAVADALSAAGIPASPVNNTAMLHADPHLRARGFFEQVTHPVAGTWDIDSTPYRFSDASVGIRLPAPTFGQHNQYVFGELLGLDARQIAKLRSDGLIGDVPLRG